MIFGTHRFTPWPVNHFFGRRSRLVRDIFKDVATENKVDYLDLFAADSKRVKRKDDPSYYAADQFHLSGFGYQAWFENLLPLVADLDSR